MSESSSAARTADNPKLTFKGRVLMMVLTAFFAAGTVICAVISIPLPFSPVPISLATMAVMSSGAVLGPKYGTLSQLVYLLLGSVGLPVFANFKGGLGVIAGPTGGYLIGYMASAFLVGIVCNMYKGEGKSFRFIVMILAMILGTAACYLLGTAWIVILTKMPVMGALGVCVVPFLPGDALKIILGSLLSIRLRQLAKSQIF